MLFTCVRKPVYRIFDHDQLVELVYHHEIVVVQLIDPELDSIVSEGHVHYNGINIAFQKIKDIHYTMLPFFVLSDFIAVLILHLLFYMTGIF